VVMLDGTGPPRDELRVHLALKLTGRSGAAGHRRAHTHLPADRRPGLARDGHAPGRAGRSGAGRARRRNRSHHPDRGSCGRARRSNAPGATSSTDFARLSTPTPRQPLRQPTLGPAHVRPTR
jgi:hypothetical protein